MPLVEVVVYALILRHAGCLMLQVQGLSVEVGGRLIVDDISFTVMPRDKVGLVGRNGAGKTSLFKVLGGAAESSGGKVLRKGGFGYLPQDPRIAGVLDTRMAVTHVLSGRQIDEPVNYSAPNKGGTYSTAGGIRWYSNSSERKVEGTELEVIWTPLRNYQLFANASWLWTAETINDPTILDPNTPGLTAAQKRQHSQNSYFAYQFRMPNVPEYRFNLNNRYTFTDGAARGLTVTLGARYASVMNISNDINFNSKRGGLTAGDYLVFDGSVAYPWEVFGVKVSTSLQVSNLTDKEHNEGSGGLRDATFFGSPPRTWWFSNSLRF